MVWHLYRAIFTDLNTNGYCLIVSRFISQTSSALAPAQLLQSKPLSLNRAAYCLPIKCIDLWPSPLRWGDWEHWDRQEEEMVTWWSQEDGWRFYWNVFHQKRCLWGWENPTIDFGQLFHITQLWLFRKRKELKAKALSLHHCTGGKKPNFSFQKDLCDSAPSITFGLNLSPNISVTNGSKSQQPACDSWWKTETRACNSGKTWDF